MLAYKSVSRISRPLKIESVCGPKSLTRVLFEDLYWMQASLNRGLLLCARAAVHSVVVTDVKATRHAAGEEGRPLMRN